MLPVEDYPPEGMCRAPAAQLAPAATTSQAVPVLDLLTEIAPLEAQMKGSKCLWEKIGDDVRRRS